MLRLYNSLTRQTEVFTPADPTNRVTMYVCGMTVYDTPHVGNARPAIVFDVLFRVLRLLYPRVEYARNITDIDDKIIARAKENGEPIEVLTTRTSADYSAMMSALNVLPPTYEPRATQHIGHMIAMIGWLLNLGYAYEAEGHVLFELASFPYHGALSRHSQEDLTVHRVEPAPYKRAPGDFVLWKPSTADQPGWDSPWGRGRPGWHIECSAMIDSLFGSTIDIHGGGSDLRFPHHECELTQSTAANEAPLARFWMHNGMLLIDKAKMAKSEGNVVTVAELLDTYPGEVIRLAMLQTHYRRPLDFTAEGLDLARRILSRWYRALEPFGANPVVYSSLTDTAIHNLKDDLNTPGALSEMHRLFEGLHRADDGDKAAFASAIVAVGDLLGILQDDATTYLRHEPGVRGTALSDDEIEVKVATMDSARSLHDFGYADALRDELRRAGIKIENTPKGTTWRRE